MTDILSLGPVLDLIERLQKPNSDIDRIAFELMQVPLPAIRALAEQHSAQLRQGAGSILPIRVMFAAADFLCAPRREPEAE